VRVIGNNVEFTSAAGFVGVVSIGYVVRGANGGSSNQANITLAVGTTNYQGMWAVPNLAEPGWGINFTHQGDVIFVSWFIYDQNGAPIWVSATLTKTGTRTYTGELDMTTGPPFSAVPYNPTLVTHTTVGTATVVFTDGNNGTFSYTLNGVTRTKALTRFVFVWPGTVCQ
jgi:hypothetical protein